VPEEIITPDKSGGEKIAQNNLGDSEGSKKAKKEHQHPLLEIAKKVANFL
jgi:hypothetical protein